MAGDADLLVVTEQPALERPDEIRAQQKGCLAVAFRVFARLGLNTGPGGHAAVRDPENREWFWTNPFGRAFETLCSSDLILVDGLGEVLEGHGLVNRAAYCIHSGIHGARSDVNASVHLHGVPGMAWSAFGLPLEPLVQDSCAFYEDHAVFSEFDGPALESIDGDLMAQALAQGKALILQNHGLLTVGASIEEAAFWMVRMQYCCDIQLRVMAAGKPKLIRPDLARATNEINGTSRIGKFGFQHLFESVVSESPDVLA
jgi:ribulose-5-phosphate 4-epimerase/fuculose-1-phosphate aldolase